MVFLYTGAERFNEPQQNILLSLGGLISNSIVPNDFLGNLFSDISKIAQNDGLVETKGIVLKNTTGATVTNVYLYHDYQLDGLVRLEWAAVTISGSQEMEKINNFRAIPYTANFFEPATKKKSRLVLGGVLTGGNIGFDIKIGLVDTVTVITPFDTDNDTTLANLLLLIDALDGINAILATPTTMEIESDFNSINHIITNLQEGVGGILTLTDITGTSINNKILIANSMLDDDVLGLWVKRSVLLPNLIDSVNCESLKQYLVDLKKAENIIVNLEWT